MRVRFVVAPQVDFSGPGLPTRGDWLQHLARPGPLGSDVLALLAGETGQVRCDVRLHACKCACLLCNYSQMNGFSPS